MRVSQQFAKSEIAPYERSIASVRLSCMIFFTYLAIAQSNTRDAAPYSAPINDVRDPIDITGSMHRSAPANLHTLTLRLIVSLFPKKLQSGEWPFGQWIYILTPHETVTNEWITNAFMTLQIINSLSLFANIDDALHNSTRDCGNTAATASSNRCLNLMTDGIDDISKDETY